MTGSMFVEAKNIRTPIMKIEVSLTCTSKKLSLKELVSWIGVEPTSGHSRGTKNPLGRIREYSIWNQTQQIKTMRSVHGSISNHIRHWNKCTLEKEWPRDLHVCIQIVVYLDHAAAEIVLSKQDMRMMSASGLDCNLTIYRCEPSAVSEQQIRPVRRMP